MEHRLHSELASKQHPSTSKERRSRAGFSLLEALVAAGLLGLGIAGLVHSFQIASEGTAITRDDVLAARIAEQVIAMAELEGAPGPGDACEVLDPLSDAAGCLDGGALRPTPQGCTQATDDLLPSSFALDASNQLATGRFRLDWGFWEHPDPAASSNARVLVASVCYRAPTGQFRQAQRVSVGAN